MNNTIFLIAIVLITSLHFGIISSVLTAFVQICHLQYLRPAASRQYAGRHLFPLICKMIQNHAVQWVTSGKASMLNKIILISFRARDVLLATITEDTLSWPSSLLPDLGLSHILSPILGFMILCVHWLDIWQKYVLIHHSWKVLCNYFYFSLIHPNEEKWFYFLLFYYTEGKLGG